MEASRSYQSLSSSSSSEEFVSWSSTSGSESIASMSGEGEEPKSFMMQLAEKLQQLTFTSLPEPKSRKVTGSTTPRRDLAEEQFFTAPSTPRKKPAPQDETTDAPDKTAPTAEEKRKKWGGTKTPPTQFGIAINKDAFEKLPESQRAALNLAYEEAQKDDELSPTSPILTPRSLSGGHKITSAVQAARRNEAFLNMIEELTNESLRKKVNFYTESLMATASLFDMLLPRITTRISEGTPDSSKKAVQLLIFCITWLGANKGTALVKKAEPKLQEIIQATQGSSHLFIKQEAKVLATNLSAALANQNVETSTVPGGHFNGKSQFSTTLAEVAKGTHKDYRKFAKNIASDLFQLNIQLFCSVSEDNLVQKWDDASQSGIEIKKFCDADNALLEFILDKIILEKELDGRRNLMKFFLQVGYYSLKYHENHQSAACIFSALNHSLLEKLPRTCKEVHAHKRFKALQEHFNGDREFEVYRARRAECEKNQKSYIPYIPLNINEFIVKEANHPSVIQEPGKDPRFNLEKLTTLQKMAKDFVAVQTRLRAIRPLQTSYTSDFVTHHIQDVAPYNEKEKDANHKLRKLQIEVYQEV